MKAEREDGRNYCTDCGEDITGEAEFMVDLVICKKCLRKRNKVPATLKLPDGHLMKGV